MVAVQVANARPPGVRGLTAAPSEPRDSAGHTEDAFSTIVVGISILMPVLDNISFRENKMSKHNHHHVTVGAVKHYGCEPVYGGIHNHLENWTSCNVHEQCEQLEVKSVHPDLPGKNLEHDGIVRANLKNTACTASIYDTNVRSIITGMHDEVHEQHEHPATVA